MTWPAVRNNYAGRLQAEHCKEHCMRVSVLYHADAGGGVSKATLRREIERHGHDVLHLVVGDEELEQALEEAPDVLVAAGGDGTVSRAARAIAGRAIPLAILPLGTANNVARSLGLDGPLPTLIDGWTTAKHMPMDFGVVQGSSGETRFIEAAGIGLVAIGIAEIGAEPGAQATRIRRAAGGYLDILARLKPRHCTATLDGRRQEGAFLLVEALNIGSVGANLVLAPEKRGANGVLTVVTAEEEHRAALVDYLEARAAGREVPLNLPTRQARQIDLEGVEELHVDDKVRTWPSRESLSIRTERAMLQVLAAPDATDDLEV